MDEQITHLVVNWIDIEEHVVLVGATDNLRWKWDIEAGMTGADAKTIVLVRLKDNGPGYADTEEASFASPPGDQTRNVSMSFLEKLFEIAWFIKNKNLDFDEAHKSYFGKVLK